MGVILDSSVLIAAERQHHNVNHALEGLRGLVGDSEIAVSVVTLIELAHGASRANTVQRRKQRLAFIEDPTASVPIHPVTSAIALRTGRIDGELQVGGVRVGLPDLLIGVTALELGFSVATANVRHFETIPGLTVICV